VPDAKGLPRQVEILLALVGLAAASPILILSAIAIALTSPGPILFRQERVGKNGHAFKLYKFRTMQVGQGLQVTARDDIRVTYVGRFLRMMKFDELPELWNVLKGDMSLVGPRPEVPCYVDLNDKLWSEVLRVKPGITDPVSVYLRNEEEVLVQVKDERERFYVQTLLRCKLLGNLKYLRRRTWRSDISVMLDTLIAVIFRAKVKPPSLEEITATLVTWETEELSLRASPAFPSGE
jgi:lipopolysaccharide/colanic/teichoic acid biosynthesis glycosyltransferase